VAVANEVENDVEWLGLDDTLQLHTDGLFAVPVVSATNCCCWFGWSVAVCGEIVTPLQSPPVAVKPVMSIVPLDVLRIENTTRPAVFCGIVPPFVEGMSGVTTSCAYAVPATVAITQTAARPRRRRGVLIES
jgi:hypothetical protein